MKNKRFIAAAVCPQCREQDKIYTYDDQDGRWRACASCDFRQRLDEEAVLSPATRPGSAQSQGDAGADIVKLVDVSASRPERQ